MRIAFLLLGLAVLAGCSSTRPAGAPPAAPPAAPAPSGEMIVAGYHPYWTGGAWREYDFDLLDLLFFFEIEPSGDGSIQARHGWPDRWVQMRHAAGAAGTRVAPTVTFFDAGTFDSLFAAPQAARALRETIVGLVRDSPGLGGVQLDVEVFERVAPAAREGFTAFVADLRRTLAEIDPALSLSVFSLAYDDYDVVDEAAVAEHVDFLVVQGYDFHARGGDTAGPVAPLDGWGRRTWRYVVDRYTGLGVPREKIVMAVPYFGYEWPTESAEPGARTRGAGETITYAPVDTSYGAPARKSAAELAARHGLRRDPRSGSPYYAYRDSTGWRQGWFEDPESLRAKYEFVRDEGLRGVAIFPLPYGGEPLEAVLREAF